MSTTKTTITEEELKELKKKSVEILSGARRALLLKYPFIGSLLMRMNLVPVRDMRVRTACTDGESVYFDIDFLSRLSTEEQIFVLGHELYHGVLLHLTRLQSRDPELFNIATDKEVNNLLKQDGLTPPCNLLFPEGNECGKSAEEIYEILLKKMKKQAKQQSQQQNGTGPKMPQAGSSSSGDGDGDENDSDDKSQHGQGGKSQQQKKKSKKQQGQNGVEDGEEQQDPDSQNTSGNKDGQLSGQFDRHQYRGQEDTARDGQWGNQQQNGNGASSNGGEDGENDQNGGGSSPVRDKWGDVGFDKDYKPSIAKDFSDKMREAVIATAQQIERQQGSLPAHIAQIVKGLMKPEIKWQELLAQFVTKCFGTDRHWLPPNRRHVYKKMYLPSRRSEKIKVAVACDTSGSCQGDLKKFLSELVGLVNSFGGYEIHLMHSDCHVDKYEKYDSDENPLEVHDNNFEFEFGGGGGTDLCAPFDYILENDIDADCFCFLTDGFGPTPEKNELGIPVMWILTKGAADDSFCSFGEKIRFQDDYDQSYDWNC